MIPDPLFNSILFPGNTAVHAAIRRATFRDTKPKWFPISFSFIAHPVELNLLIFLCQRGVRQNYGFRDVHVIQKETLTALKRERNPNAVSFRSD